MLHGCSVAPKVKDSSENHVTIESYSMNTEKSKQLADTECARYNRRAQMVYQPTSHGGTSIEDERDYVFACVD